MQGVALLVALSALGVDTAWRQTDDGQVEYVLQIEPVFLSALAEGKEIASELPRGVERVDRLCIRIGSGSLRSLAKTAPDWPELDEAAAQHAAAKSPPDAPLAVYVKPNGDLYASHDLTHGWQPASETETTYLIQLAPDLIAQLEEGDEIYASVLPNAGKVSGFSITAGTKAVTRKSVALPPVVNTAQFQAPGPRTSSPAVDAPLATDLTGGESGSIYGGAEVTDLGTDAATGGSNLTGQRNLGQGNFGQSKGSLLQPPVNQPLDVPSFDRSQFGQRQPATSGGVKAGSTRPAPRSSAGSIPASRQTAQPPAWDAGLEEEEPLPRVASRTTVGSNLGQNELPQRRTNQASTSTAEEKEPEFPAMPFTLSLFALFLSIGANLYLGWTAAEFYSRYKLAVERLRSAGRN
jgi:hypothetical protein